MTKPRVFPPLIMLIFAGVMWLLDREVPLVELVGLPWQRLGYVAMALAVVVDLWALGLFRTWGTTFHPLRLEGNRVLVTDGIYRVTRNPMYLGLLLLLTGLAVRLGSLTPFLVLPFFVEVMNRGQIVHEERFLAAKYGEAYEAYRSRVRRWV